MSKFQQRHYEAIAEVMQDIQHNVCETPSEKELVSFVIGKLSRMFRNDNYLFDGGRFERACQPGANVKARTK